jgi:hypothetical protein
VIANVRPIRILYLSFSVKFSRVKNLVMLNDLQIPKELRRKIDEELQPAEVLRWVGQPVSRPFTASTIRNCLVAIPIIMAGVYGIYQIWSASGLGGWFQCLFVLMWTVFGLNLLSSPFLVWQRAQKTVYLITDKRAISIQNGWFTIIRSYLPEQLWDTYRKERSDGTGDVVIAIRHWNNGGGDRGSEEIGFLNVRSPRDVESILRQLAQSTVHVSAQQVSGKQ